MRRGVRPRRRPGEERRDDLHRARRRRRASLAVVLDRWVARTRLTSTRDWWSAYAIIVFFQLLTNGWLTGRGIVRYDPDTILGSERVALVGDGRLFYAPVEDLAFGFALVLIELRRVDVAGSPPRPVRRGRAAMSVADPPAGDAADRRRRARTRRRSTWPAPSGPSAPTRCPSSARSPQRYGDLVVLPGARPAGAAAQRPRRRPARAADRRRALGQADRPVRRPGARHRSRPARLGRAELDRAPAARRTGLPPPAARGGGRPGARRRRRTPSPHGSAAARRRGADGASSTSPPSPTASASTPSGARCSPPTCPGRPSDLLDGDERGGRPGGPARPLRPPHAPSGPRRRPTSGCAPPGAASTRSPPRPHRRAAVAQRAVGGPARTATTSSDSSSTAA